MSINLKADAILKSARVYSVNQLDKDFINETFNKLHEQSKMK